MLGLRLVPLFTLPVLGGVLLAFVIANFEDEPDLAAETATVADEELAPQPETAVEETVEPVEDTESVTDETPPDTQDPLANLNVDGPFDVDEFNDYWRGNLGPVLADILENGFPGRTSQP